MGGSTKIGRERRWKISGADASTGKDSVVIVDASDESDAMQLARQRGLFVASITEVASRTKTPKSKRLVLSCGMVAVVAVVVCSVLIFNRMRERNDATVLLAIIAKGKDAEANGQLEQSVTYYSEAVNKTAGRSFKDESLASAIADATKRRDSIQRRIAAVAEAERRREAERIRQEEARQKQSEAVATWLTTTEPFGTTLQSLSRRLRLGISLKEYRDKTAELIDAFDRIKTPPSEECVGLLAMAAAAVKRHETSLKLWQSRAELNENFERMTGLSGGKDGYEQVQQFAFAETEKARDAFFTLYNQLRQNPSTKPANQGK